MNGKKTELLTQPLLSGANFPPGKDAANCALPTRACRRRTRIGRHMPVAGLLALLPMLSPAETTAPADEYDAIKLSVGIARQHDSNVFRIPDGVDTRSVLGRSGKEDDITVTSASVRFDRRYSLQRIQLEAGLVDYRYNNFDRLSFTATNYAAAWNWSVTPRLHGKLSADRKEALNNYGDYTGYGKRNVRTDENERFEIEYEVDGAWRVLGGLARITRSNSQPFAEEGDTRLYSAEAGLRRDFISGTSLSYITRQARGEYFERSAPIQATLLDNEFDQRENEVRLIWPLSVKTRIDARATHIKRSHEHFGARDFSGLASQTSIDWRPTEKTTIFAGLGREIGSYQSTASSYAVTDQLWIGSHWRAGAKTTLRARYDSAWRDYRGAVGLSPEIGREDRLRKLTLALDWQALRTLLISASIVRDEREANRPGLDYGSTMAGLSARLTF